MGRYYTGHWNATPIHEKGSLGIAHAQRHLLNLLLVKRGVQIELDILERLVDDLRGCWRSLLYRCCLLPVSACRILLPVLGPLWSACSSKYNCPCISQYVLCTVLCVRSSDVFMVVLLVCCRNHWVVARMHGVVACHLGSLSHSNKCCHIERHDATDTIQCNVFTTWLPVQKYWLIMIALPSLSQIQNLKTTCMRRPTMRSCLQFAYQSTPHFTAFNINTLGNWARKYYRVF